MGETTIQTLNVGGEIVQPLSPGKARVASATMPGHWYDVDLMAEDACSCRGYTMRGDCRHIRLVEEWDGRWVQAEAEQIARLRAVSSVRPAALVLATACYQDRALVTESGLAPIRTTTQGPRFKLGYELAGKCLEVAPPNSALQPEGFVVGRYREHLDSMGLERIAEALQQLIFSSGKPGGVLLGFEDATRDPNNHRAAFRDWWEEQTGVEVPELALVSSSVSIQETLL